MLRARRLRRLRRRENRAIAISFVVALWLPIIGMLLRVDGGPVRTENRALAEAPVLSTDPRDLARFPRRLAQYFADRFGFRNALVRLHARAMYEGLGVSPDPRVIVGDSGWLYFAAEGALEVWRGDSLFSASELDAWTSTLEARRTWLAAQGAGYLFTVVPEKPNIYPEYLPDGVVPLRAERRLDQLVAALRSRTHVHVVDLRPALRRGKATLPTYQRTDTHWTDYGAWLAYGELMRAAEPFIGAVAALPLRQFAVVRRDRPGGDLASMLALRDRLHEELVVLEPHVPPRLSLDAVFGLGYEPITLPEGDDRPRLVLFRDSFASFLLPYFAEHFSGIALWQYTFEPTIVREQRPALVIDEIAERRLMAPPPQNPPTMR